MGLHKNDTTTYSEMRRRAKNTEHSYKTVTIHTVRYNAQKHALGFGAVIVDVRVGKGVPGCRPSPGLVRDNMMGFIADEAREKYKEEHEVFADRYMADLEESYAKDPLFWRNFLSTPKIACSDEHGVDDPRATRFIFRNFLINVAVREGFKVIHGGEIFYDTRNKELFAAATV